MKEAARRGEVDLAYFDESGFSVNPLLRYAWTRVGEQKAVTPQSHARRFNILGCLLQGELIWQGVWQRVKAPGVIDFIDRLVGQLRRRTVLVMDNAPMHHAGILKACREQWRQLGLEIVYLPPYSPELNLIEGLWKQVKHHWYPFALGSHNDLENRLTQILDCEANQYAMNYDD